MQSPIHTTVVRNALQFTKNFRHIVMNTLSFNDFLQSKPTSCLKTAPKLSAGEEKKTPHYCRVQLIQTPVNGEFS